MFAGSSGPRTGGVLLGDGFAALGALPRAVLASPCLLHPETTRFWPHIPEMFTKHNTSSADSWGSMRTFLWLNQIAAMHGLKPEDLNFR